LANSLHPAVFGDELVKLLNNIIQVLLTHIHTPQSPLAPNPLSESLKPYTTPNKLQDLISKHVRFN